MLDESEIEHILLRKKFEHQLFSLRKIILDGVSYFIVWQGLTREYEDSIRHLGQHTGFWWQYRGFFAPTRKALLFCALMQLSKAFDKDTRNISFGNILKIALENRQELAPHATRSSLKSILNRIHNNTETFKRLKLYRNKRLAHYDADLTNNIELPLEEVQTLIEETKSIYNSIKFACERKYDDFNDIMENVSLHTKQVISFMSDRNNG